ncbi:MAG: hypothetical protein IKJ19_03355 [Clostridia bacterium]|nr:hypothetical protein [Clostridia bacterium]
MSIYDKNCDWYCDNCDAHLNNQCGFNTLFGHWTCTKCGWDNDVSDSNILFGEEEEFVRLAYIVCPHCAAHMQTYDSEYFKCPDCGCSGRYDYDSDSLIED